MEVHAHSHTPRKKWTHYLWEFIMLFLAVFCGFLAENEREHLVEHKREKQYMRAMIEDLKSDTAEINKAMYIIDSVLLPVQNYSISLLYLDHFPDSILQSLYEIVPRSSESFQFSFQDRTTQQLKNSGNLRLIRDKEVTDTLAGYWYDADLLKNGLLKGYEETRQKIKEIIFSLFDFNNYTEKTPWSPLVENADLHFLSNDMADFKRLGNYISNLRSQLTWPFNRFLNSTKNKAVRLILLIQKKYHLE